MEGHDISAIDRAEQAIQSFLSDLHAEEDATHKYNNAETVSEFQLQLVELRRKKYRLFSDTRKEREAEKLLAEVQAKHAIFVRESLSLKEESDMQKDGLWDSLNEAWHIRPTTAMIRKTFGGDNNLSRYSSDTTYRPRAPKATEEEKNQIMRKQYDIVLSRARTPKIRSRKQPLELFDPDLRNWSKVKYVGSGAHGSVYTILVNDPSIKEDSNAVFAVKEFKYETSQQKAIMANECELLLRAEKFMHIVTMVAFRFYLGIGHIFMEYVSGGDLNTMVRYLGPILENETKPVLSQILRGLKFLQDQHILHRDLKSANTLISLQGCIKIGDFSCAKDLSRHESQTTDRHPEVDSRVGSVLWMSPELAKGQELQAQDPYKTDIWSFGCIAVELLSGSKPWPTYHDNEEGLRARLCSMDSDLPVEGPPLDSNLNFIDAQGKEFLESIFTVSELRPSASDLLRHAWLRD